MKRPFDPAAQNRLVEKFRELRHADKMPVSPNAWDFAWSKIFEVSGFPAIASTSSGLSWSCGYKDGQHILPDVMIGFIRLKK